MFRQLSQPNCGCSSYPQQLLIRNQPTNNPQKSNPHKQNRSKKSLKYHSSSLNKNTLMWNGKGKGNESSGKYQTESKQLAQFTDIKNGAYGLGSLSKNIEKQIAVKKRINKQRNLFEIQRQYKNIQMDHNQQLSSLRSTQVLNKQNIHKKIVFNYPNKLHNVKNKDYELTKNTSTSELSTMLTYTSIPYSSNLYKTGFDQKSRWHNESTNKFSFLEGHDVNFNHLNSSHSTMDLQSRPKSSNINILSKLQEIMNEKQETQSIYEGQVDQKETNMEYSRVIISCRKLMEENKDQFLNQSTQIKLFDYEEKGKNSINEKIIDKSGLFNEIQIGIE